MSLPSTVGSDPMSCSSFSNKIPMPEEIDEFKPIKESSEDAKTLFKRVCELERDNLHRENPQIDDDMINLIRDAIQ